MGDKINQDFNREITSVFESVIKQNKTILAEIAKMQVNIANIFGKVVDFKEDLSVTDWFIGQIKSSMATKDYINQRIEQLEAVCFKEVKPYSTQTPVNAGENNDQHIAAAKMPKPDKIWHFGEKGGKILKQRKDKDGLGN